MGTHDPEAVSRFVRHNRLKRNTAWFSTRYQDRPWYVVVYGRYPNKTKARAAIKKLSRPLRTGRPWPRAIAGILSAAD